MSIYFFIEFVIFICFLFSFKKSQSQEKRLFYIAAFLFLFIEIFRSSVVGNDSPLYANFFSMKNLVGYGTVDKPDSTMEIGIVYYGHVLRYLFLNTNWYVPYFIFNAVFIFTPIFYLLNKHSSNKSLSLLWFMIIIHSGLLVGYFAMLRQLLGMSFLMYGYILFENRVKFWQLWLPICWGVAMIFHNSIVIMEVILFGLYFASGTKYIYYSAITVALIIRFLVFNYANSLFNILMIYTERFDSESRILRYQDNFGETSSSLPNLFLLALTGYVFVYFSKKNELHSFFLKCFIFAICIFIMMDSIHMVNRLSSLFFVFGLCGAIPVAIKKNKSIFYITIFISLLFLIQVFIGYNNWPKTDSTLPYYFMWEK